MASLSNKDIPIIAAEHIIAERKGVSNDTPTGSCWPEILYLLQHRSLSADGIIDCYSNETELIQHRFRERQMIKAGLFPINVPHGWWLLPSVPTHLRGRSLILRREAGDHCEVLREITINEGKIDRLWPKQERAPPARRGRRFAANWDALEYAIELECKKHGCFPPDDDGPKDWQKQADVEQWAAIFLSVRGEEAAESTIREHVRKALFDIKARN